MDLNKAQIIGNITQDIEVKNTQSGKNVTAFSVATNRNWTNKETGEIHEQAEFHNVVLWGKLAEIAGKYLKKWQKIYIEGRLQTRNWEAQDGTKRYRTEIMGENMIMLGGKKDEFSESDKKHWIWKNDEISIEDIPF